LQFLLAPRPLLGPAERERERESVCVRVIQRETSGVAMAQVTFWGHLERGAVQ